MKTFTMLILLFVSFAFTNPTPADGPVATYRVGAAMVTVWENEREDGSTWKNFEVDKLYNQEGQWKKSNTFDQDELLQLKAAIDAAIQEQGVIKE